MQTAGCAKGIPKGDGILKLYLSPPPSAITTTWKPPLHALRRSPDGLRHRLENTRPERRCCSGFLFCAARFVRGRRLLSASRASCEYVAGFHA